ncbi:hypothetical protein MIR68_012359 [Amoeboaphelidium protococcarum]|nr:hypothetical protein MIR68_012359 [Amoeboaphelidium protococcarum]
MTTANNNYYILLNKLLHDYSLPVLREQFEKRYAEYFGIQWSPDDDNKCRRLFDDAQVKSYTKSLHRDQRDLLISGNLDQWDITLICGLILSMCASTQSKDNAPQIDDASANDQRHVLVIRDLRNYMAHLHQMSVSRKEFTEWFSKAKYALVQLGVGELEIDALRCRDALYQPPAKLVELKALGNQAFRNKDFSKAIVFYTEALMVKGVDDFDLAVLYSNRSQARLSMLVNAHDDDTVKRESSSSNRKTLLKNAFSDAQQSVELCPEWWKAHCRLALVYQQTKRYSDCKQSLLDAKELDPYNQTISDHLEEIESLQGVKQKSQAHNLHDDDDDDRQVKDHLNLLLTRLMNELQDQKVDQSELISSMHSSDVVQSNVQTIEKAFKAMQNSDWAGAVRQLTRSLSPQAPTAAYWLGLLRYRGMGCAHDVRGALRLWEMASDQDDQELQLSYGYAYSSMCLAIHYLYQEVIGANGDALMVKSASQTVQDGLKHLQIAVTLKVPQASELFDLYNKM